MARLLFIAVGSLVCQNWLWENVLHLGAIITGWCVARVPLEVCQQLWMEKGVSGASIHQDLDSNLVSTWNPNMGKVQYVCAGIGRIVLQ